MVITEYKGMTVAEMNDFRNALRKSSIEYRVIKNTLARIASAETPIAPAKDNFAGPVGVALGYDDPVSVAKAVLDYAKKNDKLKISSGIIEGELCDGAKLKSIALLPPREVLLGILAGCMQAPASKLARLLSATITQMGYALNALKEKRAKEQ